MPSAASKARPAASFSAPPEAQPAQAGEAQHRRVLGVVAGDAERLDGRGDVAVVDLRRPDFFRAPSGALLRDVPTVSALVDLYIATLGLEIEHAQRVDAAAGAAA